MSSFELIMSVFVCVGFVTVQKNRRCGFLEVVTLNLMVALDSWLNSDEFSI